MIEKVTHTCPYMYFPCRKYTTVVIVIKFSREIIDWLCDSSVIWLCFFESRKLANKQGANLPRVRTCPGLPYIWNFHLIATNCPYSSQATNSTLFIQRRFNLSQPSGFTNSMFLTPTGDIILKELAFLVFLVLWHEISFLL